MSNQTSRYFGLPIIVVCVLVTASISLILGVIIGALVPKGATAAQDSLSGWVTTIATVVICVLTIVLALETWRLRIAQTRQIQELMLENIRPNVSVELNASHVGKNFMNVRVANSGKGIARKIRFQFLDRQDQQVTSAGQPIVKVFHKLAMFRLGVQSIGINQELTSFLFSFLDLPEDINAGVFTPYVNIRIIFEDTEGNEYINVFVVDFAQYEGFSEIGGDPLSQLATEVKSIREQLGKLSSGFNRLPIDVFNAKDRAEEAEKQSQRAEEFRRRHQGN